MSKHTPIFLKPGWTVNIDGVELTYEQIQDYAIDSFLYRKRLEKFLMGEDEQ